MGYSKLQQWKNSKWRYFPSTHFGGNFKMLRGAAKKKPVIFGRSLQNLFTHPPTPGFLWYLGERKVKFGSKRTTFEVILGGLEGFGPCLGVSHPTHPHLGEISQKKPFFLAATLTYIYENVYWAIISRSGPVSGSGPGPGSGWDLGFDATMDMWTLNQSLIW